MESFSKLQENDTHILQFHVYLVSYLVLEGNGAQNSDDTQKKLPVFPERLSTTLPRKEVVRPSCSRTPVITGFYHF